MQLVWIEMFCECKLHWVSKTWYKKKNKEKNKEKKTETRMWSISLKILYYTN